jgi:DNA ligase-associated metallophosphoesterase
MSALEITLRGERVVLLAGRAMHLPDRDTVLVADLHWGKAAAMRAAHVPVPTGTTASDLERLGRVLRDTGARELVVLGDLLHAKTGRQAGTLDSIAAWRAQHASVAMRLVRGNHDAHAGDPPSGIGFDCVDAPWTLGPFTCAHHPDPVDGAYVLAGHLHPHVALGGRGRQHLRLPCFVVGPQVTILPAFAWFTGTGAYATAPEDRLYAITEDAVVQVR